MVVLALSMSSCRGFVARKQSAIVYRQDISACSMQKRSRAVKCGRGGGASEHTQRTVMHECAMVPFFVHCMIGEK